MPSLTTIITSTDPALRDQSLDAQVRDLPLDQLIEQCAVLDRFRRESDSLYDRVRALFFLHAIYRFHLPLRPITQKGRIPFDAYNHLLSRRFEEAIDAFLATQQDEGPSDAIASALAAAYKDLAFQTLANQVRRSVRSVRGNQWMFRVGHPADQPLRLRPELLRKCSTGLYPILSEKTPVRMDLSHSGWSDIFFLGMDYPEGARVLNVSIDLAVHGRDKEPRPPVEAYLRVIDAPVLRLVSVDLGASAEISSLTEVFDFARDYLGLLKAAVIASGIIPPGLEGSGEELADLLSRVVGPGLGLEIVSNVNNIPKGSRLAVSTNLLASLISVCMRATGQAKNLAGMLDEPERRLVAARAILGEWIGGSGGGWQDSGGVWPGIKLITSARATEGDPEFGVSRGRLLPQHHVLGEDEASSSTRQQLQDSLVLVHGGMAQNVGPILEMVTEKYLLRSEREWKGRQQALGILDDILSALKRGDVPALGNLTTRNFFGPIQTIIPWATNFYTETLISRTNENFAGDFKGFWMLGGMSGGGMGFIFSPKRKSEAQDFLQQTMSRTRSELQNALPFAMEPVVYDFAINPRGTVAELMCDGRSLLPSSYYAMMVPKWLRADPGQLSSLRRAELDLFGNACRTQRDLSGMVQTLFDRLFPRPFRAATGKAPSPSSSTPTASTPSRTSASARTSATAASDWHRTASLPAPSSRMSRTPTSPTPPAASAKTSLNSATRPSPPARSPSCRWPLARARAGPRVPASSKHSTPSASSSASTAPSSKPTSPNRVRSAPAPASCRPTSSPPATSPTPPSSNTSLAQTTITTQACSNSPPAAPSACAWSPWSATFASPGKSSLKRSSTNSNKRSANPHTPPSWAGPPPWAKAPTTPTTSPPSASTPSATGTKSPTSSVTASSSTSSANAPTSATSCSTTSTPSAPTSTPPSSASTSSKGPASPSKSSPAASTTAAAAWRVNGRVRLVEGLAMPREEQEFDLSYYNSMTTWIDIDQLLGAFSLTRDDLTDPEKVGNVIRDFAARMPTYVTLKDVKKRWGHGQEDVYPVAQWEKLWSDMTAIPEITSRFVVVPRRRGQQLKDQAQLDGWLRDGSAAYVESLCEWA